MSEQKAGIDPRDAETIVGRTLAEGNPQNIAALLERLEGRHAELAHELDRAQADEARAKEALEAAAARLAQASDPTDRAKAEKALAEARAVLVAASTLGAALRHEHGKLGRPLATLREAVEKARAVTVEQQQARLLGEAREQLEAAKSAFLEALAAVAERLAQAERTGRTWNAQASNWHLPSRFPLNVSGGLGTLRETVESLTVAGEAKGAAQPCVRVQLAPNVVWRSQRGGVATVTVDEARDLTTRRLPGGEETYARYVEEVEVQ